MNAPVAGLIAAPVGNVPVEAGPREKVNVLPGVSGSVAVAVNCKSV